MDCADSARTIDVVDVAFTYTGCWGIVWIVSMISVLNPPGRTDVTCRIVCEHTFIRARRDPCHLDVPRRVELSRESLAEAFQSCKTPSVI